MKLKEATIVTVLPVADMERAKKFYAEKLDLSASGIPTIPGYASFESGDGLMLLYEREGGTKADHTVATWLVEDVEQSVEGLRGKGVEFEQYDTPELKTDERGIAKIGGHKTAWFRDTEDNILAITEVSA